ncbi:TPA: hypothetical protein KSK08_003822 [Clostridioides difficile]|nr:MULTISPECIES: hypothetical protein [Paraclostridium]HBH3615394.1 hypothetical protein [Clostridioides difficile]MBZ6007591.1 hypothetical protein [Paraclostridium bifermentans]MDU0296612.1 hypothetical protein [Paraclostridium sp. MRS3W1]UOW69751.1 hypothetical protein MTR78_17575 [Paraclostridium bifermentans]HBH3615653.1 hypothetical protein [Clostridioides difficile]
MIYILKYENYKKQTKFLRNTRIVMINGHIDKKTAARVGGDEYEENN